MRMKLYLACLLLLLGCTMASAFDFNVNGIYYKKKSSNTVEVTYCHNGYDGNEEDVLWYQDDEGDYYYVINLYNGSINIPTSVTYSGTTYQVVSIGAHAFENCSNISSIVIPNSVTEIDASAFTNCNSLSSLTVEIQTPLSLNPFPFTNYTNTTLYVPAGAKAAYLAADNWNSFGTIFEYGNIAFADPKVKALCVANWGSNGELTVAEAATVTSLGSVFRNKQNITSFDELSYFTGLTSINNEAFFNCKNLTSVTIPGNVTTIGDFAFQGCESFTSITIPDGVTTIGEGALSYCTGLNSIIIPQSVTSLTDNPFYGSGLEQIAVSSNNSKYVSSDNCNAILEKTTNKLKFGCVNTVIPIGTTIIGKNAFLKCSGLTSVIIPNGVESIEEGAFADCENLSSAIIPSSVTTIGSMAFGMSNTNGMLGVLQHCDLTYVKVEMETPPSIGEQTFFNRANATLYVPADCKAAYQAADYWKEFKEIVEIGAMPADGTYLLKNVETGKYLSKGNNWGTQAVLVDDALGALPVQLTQRPDDGSYTIYFPVGSQSQQLLFRDTEQEVYIDYNGQENGCPYWTFSDAGNGNYYIQSLTTHPTYGQTAMPGTYLGNDPTLDPADNVNGNVLNTEGMNITWTLEAIPSSRTAAQVSKLQDLVTEAQGLNLDTSEEEALLDNEDAGYVEMCGAILSLQDKINGERNRINNLLEDLNKLIACANAIGVNTDEAQGVANNPLNIEAVNDAISTLRTSYMETLGNGVDASLLPLDVTGAIVNPSFSNDNNAGWTWGENEEPTNMWNNNVTYMNSSSFDFHQVINGLPNGNYVLKVKGLHQPGNIDDVLNDYYTKGENWACAMLYANSNSIKLKNIAAETRESPVDGWSGLEVTCNGQTHYVPCNEADGEAWFAAGYYENELPFTVIDGTATMGISKDCSYDDDWVIFDDFRLEYVGQEEEENFLYADDVSACRGGRVVLPIIMENCDDIRLFQFDLTLPNGVTVASNGEEGLLAELTSRAGNNHSLACTLLDNGDYRFMVSQNSLALFSGNDGVVANITLVVADDVSSATYQVSMKNIVLTLYRDGSNVEEEPADNSSVLTVTDKQAGDANGDGKVTVTDIAVTVDIILSNGYDEGADSDGNGKVTVTDIATIVDIILARPATSRKSNNQLDPQ